MDESTPLETKRPTQNRRRISAPAGSRRSRTMLIACLIWFLLAVAGSYFLGRASVYRQYPQLKDVEKSDAILSKVTRLIQLPKDEAPNIAVINNVEDVMKEPFFAAARNNDVLIAYPHAGMAILYRPSDDILVNVGPIVTQQNTATPTAPNHPSADVKVSEETGTATSQSVPDDTADASSSKHN